ELHGSVFLKLQMGHLGLSHGLEVVLREDFPEKFRKLVVDHFLADSGLVLFADGFQRGFALAKSRKLGFLGNALVNVAYLGLDGFQGNLHLDFLSASRNVVDVDFHVSSLKLKNYKSLN